MKTFTLYFVSGLGADCKVFDRLALPKNIDLRYIDWKIPEQYENMADYAKRMAAEIDTTEEFGLVGLSFGGVMIQEMNRYVKPKFNVLISSIKAENELPSWMRFVGRIRLYNLIPVSFFTSESVVSYAFFRKLYDSRLPDLMQFFSIKNHHYLRWSIDHLLHWKPEIQIHHLHHIHGDCDPVFPIKRIHNPMVVRGGNHLMVYLKPNAVSEYLNGVINKYSFY